MADLTNLKTDTSPFTVRKPNLQLWHLGAIAVFIFLILVIASSADNWLFRGVVIGIVALAFVSLIYIIQNRSFDDKTATEFQCLVFSGAMRSNTLFTIILYQDGSIFYLDPRYVKNFESASATHNLDQFLSTIEVPGSEKGHIYDAIRNLDKADLEYSYISKKSENGEPMHLKISVSPLLRPEGFVTLNVTKSE